MVNKSIMLNLRISNLALKLEKELQKINPSNIKLEKYYKGIIELSK